jgi:hypothetical protein
MKPRPISYLLKTHSGELFCNEKVAVEGGTMRIIARISRTKTGLSIFSWAIEVDETVYVLNRPLSEALNFMNRKKDGKHIITQSEALTYKNPLTALVLRWLCFPDENLLQVYSSDKINANDIRKRLLLDLARNYY